MESVKILFLSFITLTTWGEELVRGFIGFSGVDYILSSRLFMYLSNFVLFCVEDARHNQLTASSFLRKRATEVLRQIATLDLKWNPLPRAKLAHVRAAFRVGCTLFSFFHPPHSLPLEGRDTKGAAYQFVPSICNGPRIKRLRQKNVHPNERFTESYVWSSTFSTRFHEKLHSPA